MQPQSPGQDENQVDNTPTISVQNNPAAKPNKLDSGAIALRILSIVGIVIGVVAGFLVGAFINFGACWKSQCSPIEQNAPLWIPAVTLCISVPLTVKVFKSTARKSKPDEPSDPGVV